MSVASDGKQVPTRRTKAAFADFVASSAEAMKRVWGHAPLTCIAMFWAQYVHETGNRDCWCWNTGNVKKFDGDGHDWCFLNGVWECVPDAQAQAMFASGEAKRNTLDWRKCPPGRTCVVFDPPHKQCRFRAFESLDRAMYELMLLILNRFEAAWAAAEKGDCAGFVKALKAKGYFTGSESAYLLGMAHHYSQALALLQQPPPDEAA